MDAKLRAKTNYLKNKSKINQKKKKNHNDIKRNK
jgi:hypothetical protein